jgi:hypothetical protein
MRYFCLPFAMSHFVSRYLRCGLVKPERGYRFPEVSDPMHPMFKHLGFSYYESRAWLGQWDLVTLSCLGEPDSLQQTGVAGTRATD